MANELKTVNILDKAELLRGFRTMLLPRQLEQQLADYYLKNKVFSFVHFYVGQEAVAAGVCNALDPDDAAMGNHRSHGHYLAKGGDPLKLVAEMLGRKTGCCRGKGGSMHMIDKSVNFLGTTPILGSVSALAAGTALASKLRNEKMVTAVFFGDGASEEGVVYESMNFAAKFGLPILFVIENNLYSVNSKLSDRRSAGHSQELVVTGLGLQYIKADGNDYVDVYLKAKSALSSVRGGTPAVLECVVYRHMAHSAPLFDDKAGYREVDVLEERERQDPIKKIKALMSSDETAMREIEAIETSMLKFCRETIARGSQEPFPDSADMMKDLYA